MIKLVIYFFNSQMVTLNRTSQDLVQVYSANFIFDSVDTWLRSTRTHTKATNEKKSDDDSSAGIIFLYL